MGQVSILELDVSQARTSECWCFCHMVGKMGNHCHYCRNQHYSCGICGDDNQYQLTKHHLIPQEYKMSSYNYESRIVHLCRDCHDYVHDVFSNLQLLQHYNTLEKLMLCERFREKLAREGVIWCKY